MDVFQQIEKLSPNAREYFESNSIRLDLEKIALSFSLQRDKYAILADIVGDVFLSAVDVLQLSDEIAQKIGVEKSVADGLSLAITKVIFQPFPETFKNVTEAMARFSEGAAVPKVSPEEVEKALRILEPWMDKKAPETVVERRITEAPVTPEIVVSLIQTVKLPLLKAMAEYKRIADQMISSEKIKLRNSPELVRPTLSNWIRSYREELGIGFHEPVQRGNFLFQTVNGKKLSNEDRAKLNLVLKSIEEQFPLDIDPKREVIVFPPASDTSMELAQVGNTPRPVTNRFIQPRSMPAGTVRPAAFAPGTSPTATPMKPFPPIARPKPSPENPVLANLKPLFGKTAPEKNISGETLHFSTGHVLPA